MKEYWATIRNFIGDLAVISNLATGDSKAPPDLSKIQHPPTPATPTADIRWRYISGELIIEEVKRLGDIEEK